MVTMQPLSPSSSSSLGMALISLAVSAVASCPSTSRLRQPRAPTMCSADVTRDAAAIARATRRLAIDRDQLTAGGLRDRPRPAHEALLERLRAQTGDHVDNAAVRRNPVDDGGQT